MLLSKHINKFFSDRRGLAIDTLQSCAVWLVYFLSFSTAGAYCSFIVIGYLTSSVFPYIDQLPLGMLHLTLCILTMIAVVSISVYVLKIVPSLITRAFAYAINYDIDEHSVLSNYKYNQ